MANQCVPVLCDKCRLLALANLDSVPLCPACLMAEMGASSDPYVLGKISPLYISGYREKERVMSRAKKQPGVSETPQRSRSSDLKSARK